MNYKRIFIPGAQYFFTIVLQDRRSHLLTQHIKELRTAFHIVKKTCPFTIEGIVVLPDHLHFVMALPENDCNYSQRIGHIKSTFSRQLATTDLLVV